MAIRNTAVNLSAWSLIFILHHAVFVKCDPAPVTNFCIPETLQNLGACKDPTEVTADDFTSTVLRHPLNTSNVLAVNATLVDVNLFPGLNAQGLSVARLMFGPYGVNPPHVHPRASEVLYLLEGSLYVGFVTTNPGIKLFEKVLQPGDMFIFPRGLVHFQRNLGADTPALAIAALGSQNPGRSDSALALFASTPPIMNEVLERALQVNAKEMEQIRSLVSNNLASPAPHICPSVI